MKRHKILLANLCLFAVCVVVFSVLARPQASNFPGISVSQKDLPEGRLDFTVQNLAKLPITALAAVGKQTPRASGIRPITSIRYFDSVLDSLRRQDLQPGQSHTIVFFGPNPTSSQVQKRVELRAVIFADGTSYGDLALIERIRQRRKLLFEELGNALQLLQTARSSGIPRDQLIGQLREQQTNQVKAAAVIEARQAADAVYGELMDSLSINDQAPMELLLDNLINRTLIRRARLLSSRPEVAPEGAVINNTN